MSHNQLKSTNISNIGKQQTNIDLAIININLANRILSQITCRIFQSKTNLLSQNFLTFLFDE